MVVPLPFPHLLADFFYFSGREFPEILARSKTWHAELE